MTRPVHQLECAEGCHFSVRLPRRVAGASRASALSENGREDHRAFRLTAESLTETPSDFRYEGRTGEFGTGVATIACRNRADLPFLELEGRMMSYEKCIQECQACVAACQECLYEMATCDSSNDCPKCCIECSDICELCAKAMARGSKYAEQYCQMCAEICDWCAEQCEQHDHDHCQKCAKACRACAESCRSMAGAAA